MAVILRPKHIAGLWMRKNISGSFERIPNSDRMPEEYRVRQKEHLSDNPAAVEPYIIPETIEAYVGAGAWRVHCRCNEAPHADPEWKLSCCFGCGAIYEHVVFPENWKDIEELLAKRPVQAHRNWRQQETYDDLLAEQIEHGDPT